MHFFLVQNPYSTKILECAVDLDSSPYIKNFKLISSVTTGVISSIKVSVLNLTFAEEDPIDFDLWLGILIFRKFQVMLLFLIHREMQTFSPFLRAQFFSATYQ